MPKTLGFALAALLAVAAISLWTLFAQFAPTVKSAIETEGGLATQAQVLVGTVEFSPFSGTGVLDGLTVGNPNGFSSPYAVVVNRVALQVESASVLGGGPVIVDSVTIIAPQITFKAQSPTAISNLETIKNNAQAYSATPAAIRADSTVRKVIIRDLTVMGGSISLDIPLSGGALTVPLPPLHLANIGVTTNGATPPAIIRAVCEALAEAAKKAVTEAIAQKVKSVAHLLKPPAGGLPKLPPPPLPQPTSPPGPTDIKPMPSPPGFPDIKPLPSLPDPPSVKLLPPPGVRALPPPPGF
ncbi:hypothetical protein ACYZT9_11575 [Pseudomonas sp. ZT5P21]